MKILWALEPFHIDSNIARRSHELIEKLSKKTGSAELCFVVTRTEPELTLSFEVQEKEKFTKYPKRLITELMKTSGIKIPESKIHVDDFPSFSVSKSVDRLLKNAKKLKCDTICLYSKSKKGLERLLLGSFAETAVHRSKADLLLLRANLEIPRQVKKILLLSDFLDSPNKTITKTLNIAKHQGAELVIYHSAPYLQALNEDSESKHTSQQRKKVEKTKSFIAETAKKLKVNCRVVIDTEWSTISQKALSLSREEKTDLIVVAAKSGPTMALIGGSVTRQILRSSEVPVLVLKH